MPSHKIFTTSSPGFTLLETLIAIAIFISVAGLGLFMGMDFYRSYAFRAESNTLIAALKRARNRSMDNINDAPHGIFVATSSYTLFEGPSYASRTPEQDEVFLLDNGVTLRGIKEVSFAQISGNATVSGSISMMANEHIATLSLNYEGRISW